MHKIEIDRVILEPEDGLIIGNGDLSVSIYQAPDELRFRFGKNDVWDRRLDLSDCPEPAHIKEIERGVRDEGWVSHGYVYGHGEATKGTSDPKRMTELTNGWPAYACRPYPCPKPVGELALRWPADLSTPSIAQRVNIEKGEAEVELTWSTGVKIVVRCVVSAPPTNVLAVNWRVENWNDKTSIGGRAPVMFSLYRWPDPPVEKMAVELAKRGRYKYFWGSVESGKCTPLPPPTVEEKLGRKIIEQKFYPDIEYADGFRYAMAPFTADFNIEKINTYSTGEAHLHLYRPTDDLREGWLGVAVPTSTDDGGVEGELRRVIKAMGKNPTARLKKIFDGAHAYAKEFWSRSALEMDNKVLENCWYASLHARRSTYRFGVVPPGLALPSTVQDYSLWHGDYHTNYNIQEPFWGDYEANQIDMGDSYFTGMIHMVDMGRELARKYWDARGTFIHLTGYPFPISGDPYGSGGLARMTYMTGWVIGDYWRRYLYTVDKKWLKEVGYPVIRDGALFYIDTLEKRDDGKYHAFPSVQGESFFTGKPEDYTDQPQVIRNTRYCLQVAIQAAEVLGVDPEFRADWQDRLDNLVVIDDLDKLGMSDEEKRRYFVNPPAFLSLDSGYQLPRGRKAKGFLGFNSENEKQFKTGTSFVPWWTMVALHNRFFNPEVDVPGLATIIKRWTTPGGVFRAMTATGHSYVGGYGESLGVIAPIQELMLQSWDGIIRIFPEMPKKLNAKFTTFRAEGAFIVSATRKGGVTRDVTITSERGQLCRVESPWKKGMVVTGKGAKKVALTDDGNGVFSFKTTIGGTYKLKAK